MPLVNTQVDLALDLSEGNFTNAAALSLFFDANDDGFFSDDEKVSTNGESIFSASTDDENGVLRVMVRVNLSCPYRGNLFAFAGNTSTSVQFVVESVAR